jgi:hypothetical protein
MNLPESIRRFSDEEETESFRLFDSELERLKAEYFAGGGSVTELPNKLGTPKPFIARIAPPPKPEPVVSPHQYIFWDDEQEIQAVRYMRACGFNCKEVAAMINATFKTGRNGNSVRALCNRQGIEPGRRPKPKRITQKGKAGVGPAAWTGYEDFRLKALTAEGLTIYEITEKLNAEFTYLVRGPASIRGRSIRLGLEINRVAR